MAVRHRTVSFVQGVELFGNIFAPSNSIGTWKDYVKFLRKKLRGSERPYKSNGRTAEPRVSMVPYGKNSAEIDHDSILR